MATPKTLTPSHASAALSPEDRELYNWAWRKSDEQAAKDQTVADSYKSGQALRALKAFLPSPREAAQAALGVGSLLPGPQQVPANLALSAMGAADLPRAIGEGDVVGGGIDALSMIPGARMALRGLRSLSAGSKAAPQVVQGAEAFADAASRSTSSAGRGADVADDAAMLNSALAHDAGKVTRGADAFEDAAARTRTPGPTPKDWTAPSQALAGLRAASPFAQGAGAFEDVVSRVGQQPQASHAISNLADDVPLPQHPLVTNETLGGQLEEAATQFTPSPATWESPNLALAGLKKIARRDAAAKVTPANPEKKSIAGFEGIDDLLSSGEAERVAANIKAILARRKEQF